MNKIEQFKLNSNPEGFNVKHYSFPSIGQYRNIIRNVKNTTRYTGVDENGEAIYDPSIKLPTLKYRGTVKKHGTNASLGFFVKNDEIHQTYQSRENLLNIIKDNAGFCTYQMNNFKTIDSVIRLFNLAEIEIKNDKVYQFFGEWCGKGIQKKVALAELDRMFVIFAIKEIDMNDHTKFLWHSVDTISKCKLHDLHIYNSYEAPTFEFDIDFNNPELIINSIIDVTMDVEKECPFAKVFGVSGIGEGIVLVPVDEKYRQNSSTWFKSKGELHANKSNVKTLITVDVEKVNSVNEYVEKVCTVSRLEQGFDKMRENNLSMERKNIGFYLKWVTTDVFKEELDTLLESGLTTKDVGGAISNKAKEYFFEKEKEF